MYLSQALSRDSGESYEYHATEANNERGFKDARLSHTISSMFIIIINGNMFSNSNCVVLKCTTKAATKNKRCNTAIITQLRCRKFQWSIKSTSNPNASHHGHADWNLSTLASIFSVYTISMIDTRRKERQNGL